MACKNSKCAPSLEHLKTLFTELKDIKTDLDNLKIELIAAQTRYDQRAADYETKLEELYILAENVRQEQDENEANLLNAKAEWLDVRTRLTSSVVSPKKKVILNVGGEYFETTVDTLTKSSQGTTTYFTALFSKQWQLERDPKDESIFIDRNGHLFGYILQYFRTGQIAIDPDCSVLRRDLITEARFYQLHNLVGLLKTNDVTFHGPAPVQKKLFSGTTLLSSADQIQLNKLSGYVDQQWQLIYKASRDGYTASIFHKFCDDRFPTMSVIRSKNGCLFGGFTTVAWSSSGLDKEDTSAFLFTLKNPHGIPPTKYPVQEKSVRFAVCHNPVGGLTFGSIKNRGSDIFLHSPFNAAGSRSFFPQSYEDSTCKGRNTFTGDSRFICDDVEVFTPI